MRALVTGGAGFIGGHLVDALIARGDSVVVIDKAEPNHERKNAKAEYVKLDINDAGLEAAVLAAKPEVVFHLAAYLDDRGSMKEPEVCARENIRGSLQVFQACKAVGVKKIIFSSTNVVYGLSDKAPYVEDVAVKPITPYAISKYAGELYLQFYYKQYGIPYVAFRLANVYGPGQDASREYGAVAVFTGKLLKGEAIFINNDGQTVRENIHVSDVVSGMLAAADKTAIGVFNLGTGRGNTTQELYDMLAEVIGSTAKPLARPEVQDLMKTTKLDISKAKKELEWEPKVALEDGIRETVEWYRSRV